MHILVVEDDATVRELIVSVLQRESHSVTEATDGLQALAVLANQKPDAIILDINMPNMDGLTLLSRLKSDFPGEEFSVLMLTAQSAPEDIKRAVQLGAKDYIGKPFEPRQLLRRLDRITRV